MIEDDPTGAEGVGDRAEVARAERNAEAYELKPRGHYEKRPGYDERFLGADVPVPMPWLNDAQYADVAWNRSARRARHVLAYFHFSVVQCRSRRLAYFAAVNVDGKRERKIERNRFHDKWFYDPRLPESEQHGNDLYVKNPLDRGHLVRRLDPTWGATFTECSAAHDDSFHWTNCSPQHQDLNRDQEVWAGLENYILRNANTRDLRVSVFSGPVFGDYDPTYETEGGQRVQIPRDYWKVVVMVKQDGTLSATAYAVSQANLIDDLIEAQEAFAFGRFKTFQTTVRKIEALTGLSFNGLDRHDPKERTTMEAISGDKVLESMEQIFL